MALGKIFKWLLGGAGFGEAKNSGWRNAIAGGISEKFAFKTPIIADNNQRYTRRADVLLSACVDHARHW